MALHDRLRGYLNGCDQVLGCRGARVLQVRGAQVHGCAGALLLGILCNLLRSAQTGSITGTITTSAKGTAPVRVTIDQKVCGNELPDEAIVVDAQGRLANAVVILTGVKRARG